MVQDATRILLVEATGKKPSSNVDGARNPSSYSFTVLEVIKGESAETFELPGDGDLGGIWDTTFSDHSDEGFWNDRSGRMGIQGSCDMVAPAFVLGAHYLIFVGIAPDTKQFERVEASTDRWLIYVKKQVRSASH